MFKMLITVDHRGKAAALIGQPPLPSWETWKMLKNYKCVVPRGVGRWGIFLSLITGKLRGI